MRNLTLDAFWITFMPMYLHTIGIITAVLSSLVIYLILTKTPESGRTLARYLLLTQLTIILADAGWAILDAPVLLFPLQAALCLGITCGTAAGRHLGVVMIFQCMVHVAMMVTYTIHFKYTTIVQMVKHREVTQLFELADTIDSVGNLSGIGYNFSRHQWIPVLFAVVFALIATISERTRKMQQRLTWILFIQISIPLIIEVVPHLRLVDGNVLVQSRSYERAVVCATLPRHIPLHLSHFDDTELSRRPAMLVSQTQGDDDHNKAQQSISSAH